MRVEHALRAACFLMLTLPAGPEASGIITRHDVSDEAYLVDDAQYPGLVDLLGPGDCIGTLITEDVLLTVAHCAEEMQAGQTLTIAGDSHDVREIILHPEWKSWNYDIALIRLNTAVTSADPYPLYRAEDEVGMTLTLVGRGLHATGLEGEAGATDDQQLRRATNTVTQANKQWLEVHFEAPGEAGITDLEGVGAGGDSGGPAFVETADGLFIAGLNSWGDGSGSIKVGQYGAQDYSTRISQFTDWIDAEAGIDSGETGSADTDTGGDERATKSTEGCSCSSTRGHLSWLYLLPLICAIVRRGSNPSDKQAQAPNRFSV